MDDFLARMEKIKTAAMKNNSFSSDSQNTSLVVPKIENSDASNINTNINTNSDSVNQNNSKIQQLSSEELVNDLKKSADSDKKENNFSNDSFSDSKHDSVDSLADETYNEIMSTQKEILSTTQGFVSSVNQRLSDIESRVLNLESLEAKHASLVPKDSNASQISVESLENASVVKQDAAALAIDSKLIPFKDQILEISEKLHGFDLKFSSFEDRLIFDNSSEIINMLEKRMNEVEDRIGSFSDVLELLPETLIKNDDSGNNNINPSSSDTPVLSSQYNLDVADLKQRVSGVENQVTQIRDEVKVLGKLILELTKKFVN